MTSSSKALWVIAALVASVAGCSAEEEEIRHRPLQPLVYTEVPGLTPEGAAVREDRLMREIVERHDHSESDDGEPRQLPILKDPDILGRAITEALIERDNLLWEHVFVRPEAYTGLVGVRLEEAEEFVDNQIGASLDLWRLFAASESTDAVPGGLGAILEYDGIELGRGRTVDGGVARDDEDAVQFWGSRVFLRHREEDLRFELRISRVFRVPGEEGGLWYQVASEVEGDRRFRTFLDVGLHLRPELLRTREYPYPLQVGNFWRYRRYDAETGRVDDDPLDIDLSEVADGAIAASEVSVEVRQVSQHGPVRLVELLRSYDDQDYTRNREWWVLTARRIYVCSGPCRNNIDDLAWLLTYFENQVPILRLPAVTGATWGNFSVRDDWETVEAVAGTFPGTVAIEGVGSLAATDRFLRGAELVRYFAPGRGEVFREIRGREGGTQMVNVVEELVEYRITE